MKQDQERLELLQKCLHAFEAMKSADGARKLLSLMGHRTDAYIGKEQSVLASFMIVMICDHLGLKDD
jgi:hypothetical protein